MKSQKRNPALKSRIALIAQIAGCALLLAACDRKPAQQAGTGEGKSPPQAAPAPAAADSVLSPQPAFAAPDTFKAALGKVFEGYSRIQTALAQDDLAKAKEAFSTMHAVLHMMPKEGLDSAALAAWDSTDARIMEILHPMASAGTLEAARGHFMEFSDVLADAIGKFGIAGSGPVYQFHCPMAKDNKGARWLQGDSALANPYFGKSMPKCGEVVRKLES